MTIRLANPADALDLAKLRYHFRSITEADSESEELFLDRCSKWMAERLRQTTWRCWIVEREQSILGALWLQLIDKIPNPTDEPESHGYITNVFVDEAERGQGIGSQLLETALQFCRELPVHSVILWPSEKSRPLYERNGFAVRDDLFELSFWTGKA